MASQDDTTQHKDQLTFDDPVTRHPDITPPVQHQPKPGLDAELMPTTDRGQTSYRGTGRLEGRRALITGGDSGIGGAVAIAYAREGADVAINYLPEEEEDADLVAGLVEAEGRTCVRIPADLREREACDAIVAKAVEGLGGLDALVVNAGRQTWSEAIVDISDEQFDNTVRTNIYAMFWICRAAVPHLQPGSTIVMSTSVQAYSPSETLLDYAMTKAAINTFAKGLAKQLAPEGVRVNAVAPGPVWTPLQVAEGQPKKKLPTFGQGQPIGRAAQPVELAPAYVFLASPESSYVIGETLNVNGGADSP
ncbi:SDR family oxidoreductase [Ornithinimicrobium avium]|uniref:SDR family NAD(P)-dependent oxidoreductase n=1 Tax=Ornithinimicrobium avium TaxID=2283195 RepID=A0A345NL03_9MICO|nr:SDR family oxidoreductase [Ornithinimicrobium avium]AXH95711.1 SDR family NAD(P)-dependent oxidoreductase [Ornithinimicrobium avium]